MLSIKACGKSAADYYLSKEVREYYLAEGDTSLWLGTGAEHLGLFGKVEDETFKLLFAGRGPDGTKLVQNADRPDRKPGWDLTFSAPKGVSIIWAISGSDDRRGIEGADRSAVRAAIDYLEATAAFTRREKGGVVREPVSMVIAGFSHGTSRNLDPQLHTHCIDFNLGVRADRSTGSVVSHELYRAKMAAGAVYQAKLSAELESLGYETRPALTAEGYPRGFLEVVGVPRAVCDAFSTRRQEVLEALKARGVHSAAAAEFAALETRSEKEPAFNADELFALWETRASELGFGREQAERLRKTLAPRDRLRLTVEAFEAAKGVLNESVSFFTERTLFREALVRTIGNGVEPEFVQDFVARELAASRDLVSLGRSRGDHQFTTREIWNSEAQLLASVKTLAGRTVPALNPATVSAAIEAVKQPGPGGSMLGLSTEQREAVRYLTGAGGSIRVLSGYAGTGKTQALKAVREAYERDGFTVLGAAVAGIASRGLERGSGIKSDTVALRLLQLERSIAAVVRHHAKQLLRAALNLPTSKPFAKLTVDPKTVLVVDEAAMLGTKDLSTIVKAVERGGGRLILVGDHRQLPPIGPGGGFRSIADRHGCYELTEVGRQREAWARQKGKDIADGDAEKAVRTLVEKGRLSVSPSREHALKTLIFDWAEGGVSRPQGHVILAATNAEVRELNRDAQRRRLDGGELGARVAQAGGDDLRTGDRVVFRKNDRRLGVFNGSLGTVTAVSPSGRKVAVVLDGETETTVVDLRKYRDVSLGYAVTVHRSQGATFENTYSLLGGSMTSRELGYVMATRERESARFYTDRLEAGDDLARLARGSSVTHALDSPLVRSLTRSEEKILAHDLTQDQERNRTR